MLAAALIAGGCHTDRWQAGAKGRAPEYAVAKALDDVAGGAADISADAVPVIRPPGALRPCCALGVDLQVAVGRVPIPGLEIGNVTGGDRLGHHRFNNGFLSLDRRDERGWVDNEANGIVYTCRGGFLDTAHVRDNADIMLACISAVARLLDSGGSFELPSQGGRIEARIAAMDPAILEKYGRRELTLPMAAWLAFQVSIWHEIATWYGYTSLTGWPEKLSAFSPEDLYSNLVGIKIAAGIVDERGASSGDEYNRSMDAWIEQVGKRLGALSTNQSRAAVQSMDGIWWDSTRRVPDWQLVRKRSFDTGPVVAPWLVADATPPPDAGKRFTGCDAGSDPVVLRAPDGFEGLLFRDYMTLTIDVGDEMAAAGFPFVRDGSRSITQDDFPRIIGEVRREIVEAFGAGADRP
jgi:hypothetical protein